MTPAAAVGLPDDRCQCEHWGYVLEGKLIFYTAQGEEEFVAGDAYQVGPGHTPEIFPGPGWSSSAPRPSSRGPSRS
ncbi:MAG TPA: hypothetical protein VNO34_10965 [Actinomycetota bacterium]|nr:hypothetical protein [Actinomycetota bacterium]